MIREVERAKAVRLLDCLDRPIVEPIWLKNQDGTVVGAYGCENPDCAAVHYVASEETRQWRASFEGIAEAVASALRLSGKITTHHAGRVVHLGRLKNPPLECFLARGAAWPNFDVAMLPPSKVFSSLVIGLHRLPPTLAQPPNIMFCSAVDLLVIEEGHLAIQKSALPHGFPGAGGQQWITVTEAARLLINDVDGLDLQRARARVSANAERSKFMTNGKQKRERLIDRVSFDAWRLAQREADLARADDAS